MKKTVLIAIFILFLAACGEQSPDLVDSPQVSTEIEIVPTNTAVPNSNNPCEYPANPYPDEACTPVDQFEGSPATFDGQIVFHSGRAGALQLFTLDGATGQVRQLSTGGSQAYDGDWSNDCQAIAYSHELDSTDSEIYIYDINSNSSSPLDVGTDPSSLSWAPAYAPAENGVAYQTNPNTTMNVCIADTNSGSANCMDPSTLNNAHPTYTPDGNTMVFASNRDGDWEIYSQAADLSSPPVQLTNNINVADFHPSVSPDGQFIAYQSTQSGGTFDIFVMQLDGTPVQQLTFHPEDDVDPTWTANNKIIFASFRIFDYEIYIMDADGENLERLTFNPGEDRGPDWCASN